MVRNGAGRTVALLAGACVALLAACGGPDGDGRVDTTGVPTMGAAAGDTLGLEGDAGAVSDPQIVARLSAANAAEIAAGRIAQDKARNADVQRFARDMVAEHQAMQNEVDQLVTRARITPQPAQSDTLGDRLQQARQQLDGEPAGAGFDRLYLELQVRDHEGTLDLLNGARGAAQHADLRTLIDSAIPTVRQHLERARQLRGQLGGA